MPMSRRLQLVLLAALSVLGLVVATPSPAQAVLYYGPGCASKGYYLSNELPGASNYLSPGECLIYDTSKSNGTGYQNSLALIFQASDRNLVLYEVYSSNTLGPALWSSGAPPAAKNINRVTLQPDGNLVMHNQGSSVQWCHTATYGHPDFSLWLGGAARPPYAGSRPLDMQPNESGAHAARWYAPEKPCYKL